jgi:hypothetical protein
MRGKNTSVESSEQSRNERKGVGPLTTKCAAQKLTLCSRIGACDSLKELTIRTRHVAVAVGVTT